MTTAADNGRGSAVKFVIVCVRPSSASTNSCCVKPVTGRPFDPLTDTGTTTRSTRVRICTSCADAVKTRMSGRISSLLSFDVFCRIVSLPRLDFVFRVTRSDLYSAVLSVFCSVGRDVSQAVLSAKFLRDLIKYFLE